MPRNFTLSAMIVALASAAPTLGSAQVEFDWFKRGPVLTIEQAREAVAKKLRNELQLRLLRDQPDLFTQATCLSAFKLDAEVGSVSPMLTGITVAHAKIRATNALSRPIRGADIAMCFVSMSLLDIRKPDQITLIPGESIKMETHVHLTKGLDY